MKTIIATAALALALPVLGSEKISFEVAKEPKIGESNAFELTKTSRAILRTGGEGYIVLELVDSSREDGGKTFTEACSISWTLITPSSIQSKVENVFIRYRPEKTGADSFTVETIGGSDEIEVGGLSIRWSYASPSRVFLYPVPGTKYATIKVEQGCADQPAIDPDSKSGGKEKPEPESEGRSQ